MRRALALCLVVAAAPAARAEPEAASAATCLHALDSLGVQYKKAKRRGIDIGVEVKGPLGGIEYHSYDGKQPLVIDCCLAFPRARAGELLRARGIERVTSSSASQRRNIRGTSRPSRHSYGLAIDVHTFFMGGGERVAAVNLDYEQGLGDDGDCMGDPLT